MRGDLLGELGGEKSRGRLSASWSPWDARSVTQSTPRNLRTREVDGVILSIKRAWSSDVQGQEKKSLSSRREREESAFLCPVSSIWALRELDGTCLYWGHLPHSVHQLTPIFPGIHVQAHPETMLYQFLEYSLRQSVTQKQCFTSSWRIP